MTDSAQPEQSPPHLIIDLLRHGEPEGGRCFRGKRDDPLTDRGWQQLWAAIDPPQPWDAIISSHARRCHAFAEKLADRLQLPFQLQPDFSEIDFGDWEGRTASDIMQTEPQSLQRYWQDPVGFTPPGAESLYDFEQRVLRAWQALLSAPPGQHLLLVIHGGSMRLLIAHCLGMPLNSLLRLGLGHAAKCRLRIDFDDHGKHYPSLVFPDGEALC
jgi:alpha-ribazole phosphatase